MSAIFGLVGAHCAEELDIMATRLGHRGRHNCIEHADDRLSFGAIGEDPEQMIYRDESVLAVAAGRVYGWDEEPPLGATRANLAELLHQRFAHSGVNGLAGLDGDFAAVIVMRDGLTLLRDFFGCIPLFWARLDNGCLAFASEYKAICGLQKFTPVVDRSMLQHLQATKRIPVGRTLLGNIHAARPGATVIENSEVTGYKNFRLLSSDVSIRDKGTAKRVVESGLREATRRRAGGGGPIGLALSGGIDSISMAFQLRSLFPEREIHTFTAGYGEGDPEMATAAAVAAESGTIHHPVETPPSLVVGSLQKLVWHMEDPTARSEAMQLMRIGEHASNFVGLLLSGQGADGLFAGMLRHRLIRMAGRVPLAREALFEIFDLTQRGLEPRSLPGKAIAMALFRGNFPPVPAVIGGGKVSPTARLEPGPDFLNRVLAASYQDAAFQDAAKFERTFGASGIGYAAPCLDVSFARAAFTIDERLKIRNGVEKYIFRSAVSSLVPAKYRAIGKHPQRMQYDVAFADCLDEAADGFLSPKAIRSRGFFEQQSIDRLRERQAGKPYPAEVAMRLWTAIATEIWARLFLDNDVRGLGPHSS